MRVPHRSSRRKRLHQCRPRPQRRSPPSRPRLPRSPPLPRFRPLLRRPLRLLPRLPRSPLLPLRPQRHLSVKQRKGRPCRGLHLCSPTPKKRPKRGGGARCWGLRRRPRRRPIWPPQPRRPYPWRRPRPQRIPRNPLQEGPAWSSCPSSTWRIRRHSRSHRRPRRRPQSVSPQPIQRPH